MHITEPLHVTGLDIDQEGRPRIQWRRRDMTKDRSLIGDTIAWRLSGARRCIGYRAPSSPSLLPCPDSNEGLGGQCEACLDRSKILPCLRCRGDICRNPARSTVCIQDGNHAVYLASFGHGQVKVGVAAWSRRHERLAEQGARAGLIVGRSDGLRARRMEHSINRSGIPDRMSLAQHASALRDPATDAELVAELTQVAEGLKLRMGILPWVGFEQVTMNVTPITDAIAMPVEPGSSMHGTVLSHAGSIVTIERADGSHIVTDLKAIVGYELLPLDYVDPFEQRLPGIRLHE